MSHPPSRKRFKQAQLPFTLSSSVNQNADATPTTSNNASGTGNVVYDLLAHDQTSKPESTIVPLEPFHPPSNFKFKVTDDRTCHSNWFQEWTWLHYDEEKDAVFCHICASAIQQKLMPLKEKKSKTNFIECGFRKWKNATEQFRVHEVSEFHMKAAEKLIGVTKKGIDTILSDATKRAQELHRQGIEVIFSAIFYLGKQGFPLRGHGNKDGPFYNLVFEMAREKHDLLCWLQSRDNFLSSNIQNEILELIARELLREITKEASDSHFLGIAADGTTDLSGTEQFATCIQYVDQNFVAKNVFVGFYNPSDSKGETLASTIVDVLIRLAIPL